ncbi:hypothetical protein D5S17_15445 [Pseudonocardiaceae bacterium YIM PH 21723]|nr:hypothetical protein D5S17_15445 [Pseudonocardiaceae bacterium YIM PH 21723]
MFGITPENVLKAAAAMKQHGEDLMSRVAGYRSQMRCSPAMGDPVSKDVAKALNWKLIEAPDSYANRAKHSAEQILDAANSLQQVAKTYGYTDDDIAAALNKKDQAQ